MKLNSWRRQELKVARNRLLDGLKGVPISGERLAELAIETCRATQHCGRASSLVECFNSILRKYLQVYKRTSQRALELIGVRWNLSPRRAGQLRGTSPYTALTDIEVEDWLTE